MNTLAIACQIIVALGIVNVWLLRYDRPTPWRPAGSSDMVEEFRRYGLPDWMRRVVGAAKLTLAALLVVGIWYPALAATAGAGMALLMAGAVWAHLRVRDPLVKSVPALTLLLLSLFILYANLA